MSTSERTLWVGYTVLALGYLLLGYAFGEGAQGKGFSIGDIASIVGVIISIGFLGFAYKGLEEYKLQHRYEGAKASAEEILRRKTLFKINDLNKYFDLLCFAAFQLTEEGGYKNDKRVLLKLLRDMKAFIGEIDVLTEEVENIRLDNVKLKKESNLAYENISELINKVGDFKDKIHSFFGYSNSVIDDMNNEYNEKLRKLIVNKIKGEYGGSITEIIAIKMKIDYPIPWGYGNKLRNLYDELESIVAGDYVEK